MSNDIVTLAIYNFYDDKRRTVAVPLSIGQVKEILLENGWVEQIPNHFMKEHDYIFLEIVSLYTDGQEALGDLQVAYERSGSS